VPARRLCIIASVHGANVFLLTNFVNQRKGMFWEFYFSSVNWIKFVSFLEHFPKNFIAKILEKNLSKDQVARLYVLSSLFFFPLFSFALFCTSHALNQSQVYFFLCKMVEDNICVISIGFSSLKIVGAV
jgi:hypothetical protein